MKLDSWEFQPFCPLKSFKMVMKLDRKTLNSSSPKMLGGTSSLSQNSINPRGGGVLLFVFRHQFTCAEALIKEVVASNMILSATVPKP